MDRVQVRLTEEQVRRALLDGICPAVSVHEVDEDLYRIGVTAHRAALRGGVARSICLDADFAGEEFSVVPHGA